MGGSTQASTDPFPPHVESMLREVSDRSSLTTGPGMRLGQLIRASEDAALIDVCHVWSLPPGAEGFANELAPYFPRAFPTLDHHWAMTRIRESAAVQYPAVQLQRLLDKYMDERRRADGSICLPLRVGLHKGRRDGLFVDHDIVMRFRRGRDPQNLNDTFYVDWIPAGDGPYPTFTGFMNVYSEKDPRFSRLEIDGTYVPPGGFLGRVFDAAVGSRVARASIVDFVDRVAAEIAPAFSSPTRI
jgi:hypothetical protein